MDNKILQIDLQNDITPQIGSYDNTGNVTPNNWRNDAGVYSLGPTNVDGTTPYYWFTPTKEVTDFDLCWEDYQNNSQTTSQYHLEIGDSAGNVVLSALRSNDNYYIGPVNVGEPAYQTWHKILVEVRKASASSSTVTAYVDGKKVATDTSATLLTSAKIALLGHVPNVYYWQNAGQRVRYVTIYDRSYSSKGVNLDGIMTTITGFVNKLKGALSTVAFSGSYNDLSDKPTISTVNDGTLTIQKNGTNVATFTANQSTAATANITVPTAVSELTNDSGYLTSSSNLDASKLTSGTVDIARLPQGALERLIKVANEAARYALTIADVQLGDTVQQLDTGIMYIVTDADHLDSAAGYTEYTAGTAASVPWSGVTGKPTFAAVATSGAYSDLTGTPTIPTVNDATLTIQQNGVNVQTFTANASTNATANIQCVDLTNNQTVGGAKTFYTSATSYPIIKLKTAFIEQGLYDSDNLRGVAFRCADKNDAILGDFGYKTERTGEVGSYFSARTKVNNTQTTREVKLRFKPGSTDCELVPDTTNLIDLGGSSYQWNNAYIKSLTINGVVCGDILTHNVSEFVDVTSAQTIGGVKTFSAGLFASKSTAGELAILEDNSINSTNEDANGMPLIGHTNSLKIKGSQFNVIPCMLTGQLFTTGDTSAELRVYKYKDTSRIAGFNIRYIYASDVAQAQFISCDIITSANGVYNIGSSIARWKNCYTNAINGIAPDELGLPTSTYTDVSSYITNFDSTPNNFTAPVSGLLYIEGTSQNIRECAIFNNTKGYMINLPYAYYNIRGLIPVEKGDNISVYINSSLNNFIAKIFHLKGKV